MIFWAYNPLAGGLLTGKYRGADLNSVGNSRFKDNQIYQNIFWKREILNSLVDYWKLGDNNKCIETAYQWLNKYSELRDSDKIIVGVSSVEQLENNIELFKKDGDFDRATTEILDSIYNKIINISPNYYY
jgi:aflatoxin B1 aldehyde reductase